MTAATTQPMTVEVVAPLYGRGALQLFAVVGATESDAMQENKHLSDCERCGRNRAPGRQRHTVTFEDRTDATIDFEKTRLCGECYEHVRGVVRRSLA